VAALEVAVHSSPWALTDNYISAIREGGGQLALTGLGDPTGRGRGYSFSRDLRRVRCHFRPFLRPPVCLPACLSVRPSVRPSVCRSVCVCLSAVTALKWAVGAELLYRASYHLSPFPWHSDHGHNCGTLMRACARACLYLSQGQATEGAGKGQPKEQRGITGTEADLRRLSMDAAKAVLLKLGVTEEEIVSA
jgi:Protein of unknown function (DUF3591)